MEPITLFLFLVALIPAVFYILYVDMFDSHKPEPRRLLFVAALVGAVVALAVTYSGLPIFPEGLQIKEAHPFVESLTIGFLRLAIPIEVILCAALFAFLSLNKYYDEYLDGIVYAVCVDLGFAAVENVSYVFGAQADWASTAISRALLAVPGHYAFAVLMGYFYSVYHFVDDSPKTAVCILLVPVVAHGIYDALAMSGIVNEYVGGIAFFVLIYFCVKMHKAANKKVLALIEKDKSSASEA